MLSFLAVLTFPSAKYANLPAGLLPWGLQLQPLAHLPGIPGCRPSPWPLPSGLILSALLGLAEITSVMSFIALMATLCIESACVHMILALLTSANEMPFPVFSAAKPVAKRHAIPLLSPDGAYLLNN